MEALGSIGKFFSGGGGKLLDLGLLGAGLGGNIAAERQRSQVLSELNNPQDLANRTNKLAGNLNPALIQAINNQVGGTLAEQGLSQSPGIIATSTSQALAPYIQQNQNTALNAVMQSLYAQLGGLPKDVNLAPLIALLQKQPNATGGALGGAGGGALDQWQNYGQGFPGSSGEGTFGDVPDFSMGASG